MSRALVEEVTWDNRRVTSVDWETYKSLHLDYEMPTVETVFVTPANVPATGAGRPRSQLLPLPSETLSSMPPVRVSGRCPSLRSE